MDDDDLLLTMAGSIFACMEGNFDSVVSAYPKKVELEMTHRTLGHAFLVTIRMLDDEEVEEDPNWRQHIVTVNPRPDDTNWR